MCMKKRPSAASHDFTRVINSRQFMMCSNISTETMRSNCRSGSNTFMSAVTTRRFFNPRPAALRTIYSRCVYEFDTAVTSPFGNCRAIHSDSEPQPQPSSRIDCPSARSACSTVWRRLLLGVLQRRRRLLVEARRVFAVRPQYGSEECRRHLAMLGIGFGGVLGKGTCRHLVRKRGVAFRVAAGQPRRGARAQPLDGGANDDVRQRHPFGGADHSGNEVHVATPSCGGSGKNMLVRD